MNKNYMMKMMEKMENFENKLVSYINKESLLKEISQFAERKLWTHGITLEIKEYLDSLESDVRRRSFLKVLTFALDKGYGIESKENIFHMIKQIGSDVRYRVIPEKSHFEFNINSRTCRVIFSGLYFGTYSFEEEKFIDLFPHFDPNRIR